MERVLLVRYGEIHLKGKNRPFFERLLLERIEKAAAPARVAREEGRYVVSDYDPQAEDAILTRLLKVFGIYSVSRTLACEKDWQAICEAAVAVMRRETGGKPATFKVNARRSDKTFMFNSLEIAAELGGHVLDSVPGAKVDVQAPEIPLGVEIRGRAYVYAGEALGSGGMPLGSNGRAALLLSGGIDSPVAGYMIAKRGVCLELVHFFSFPFTGERAKQKVIDLSKILALYAGPMRLHVVHFTDIQTETYEKCPESQLTVLMRRFMMAIAERIAVKAGCGALVTGEAIGQVASQTLESLAVTDDAVKLPVFRPLIGFDKLEIMDKARKIGTYDTSILPFEDCCTVFVPKHPVTRPRVEDVRRSEQKLDAEALILAALEKTEVIEIE